MGLNSLLNVGLQVSKAACHGSSPQRHSGALLREKQMQGRAAGQQIVALPGISGKQKFFFSTLTSSTLLSIPPLSYGRR